MNVLVEIKDIVLNKNNPKAFGKGFCFVEHRFGIFQSISLCSAAYPVAIYHNGVEAVYAVFHAQN
jgi:hypothetical protein